MADAHAKHHDYHLVDPSPWPIIGAVSAFALAIAAIYAMHGQISWWWLDARRARRPLHHVRLVGGGHQGGASRRPYARRAAPPPLRHDHVHRLGGDVLRRLVLGFLRRQPLSPARRRRSRASRRPAGTGRPTGIEAFDPWHLPLLNTLILLTSGTTVTWAHHALLHNDRQGLKWGLALTIVLGLLFTCVQAYEYAHAAFAFSGNIYGATFFMATGFHGFHVIIGTIFLIVCLIRANLGHFTPQQHFGFEAAAWYWHFVDVVWLFLFICIYVWGSAGAVTH